MSVFRSLVFWSGIFVLISLGWAWRDSLQMESNLSWDGAQSIRLRSADSQVEIYVAEGAQSGFSMFRTPVEEGERPPFRLPRPYFERGSIGDQPVIQAGVPLWLVTGIFVLVWLPLLGWSTSRRIRARRP